MLVMSCTKSRNYYILNIAVFIINVLLTLPLYGLFTHFGTEAKNFHFVCKFLFIKKCNLIFTVNNIVNNYPKKCHGYLSCVSKLQMLYY